MAKNEVKIEILDHKRLDRLINTMPEAVNSGIKKVITRAALMVEREAKLNVSKTGDQHPQVDTGRLRASITHIIGTEGGIVTAKVGTNVYYGPTLEFGTAFWGPYPWLLPALMKIQPIYKKDLKTALINTVKAHWRAK